jgi:hypothetical protein
MTEFSHASLIIRVELKVQNFIIKDLSVINQKKYYL